MNEPLCCAKHLFLMHTNQDAISKAISSTHPVQGVESVVGPDLNAVGQFFKLPYLKKREDVCAISCISQRSSGQK
jgi:hypothetical protein